MMKFVASTQTPDAAETMTADNAHEKIRAAIATLQAQLDGKSDYADTLAGQARASVPEIATLKSDGILFRDRAALLGREITLREGLVSDVTDAARKLMARHEAELAALKKQQAAQLAPLNTERAQLQNELAELDEQARRNGAQQARTERQLRLAGVAI